MSALANPKKYGGFLKRPRRLTLNVDLTLFPMEPVGNDMSTEHYSRGDKVDVFHDEHVDGPGKGRVYKHSRGRAYYSHVKSEDFKKWPVELFGGAETAIAEGDKFYLTDRGHNPASRGVSTYQWEDKQLVWRYALAHGISLPKNLMRLPFKEWAKIRDKFYDKAVSWAQAVNFPQDHGMEGPSINPVGNPLTRRDTEKTMYQLGYTRGVQDSRGSTMDTDQIRDAANWYLDNQLTFHSTWIGKDRPKLVKAFESGYYDGVSGRRNKVRNPSGQVMGGESWNAGNSMGRSDKRQGINDSEEAYFKWLNKVANTGPYRTVRDDEWAIIRKNFIHAYEMAQGHEVREAINPARSPHPGMETILNDKTERVNGFARYLSQQGINAQVVHWGTGLLSYVMVPKEQARLAQEFYFKWNKAGKTARNPGTGDAWNAGNYAGGADKRQGVDDAGEAYRKWLNKVANTGPYRTVRDDEWAIIRQNFIHAYMNAQGRGVRNPDDGEDDYSPVDARELELFIENDADLYRQQYTPINRNLATKKARGTYNHALAVKGFMHLADAGAKKYAKEYGSRDQPWHVMFPMATRREVAKSLTDTFETEYELGNYAQLLPAKYQKSNPAGEPEGVPVAKFAKGGFKAWVMDDNAPGNARNVVWHRDLSGQWTSMRSYPVSDKGRRDAKKYAILLLKLPVYPPTAGNPAAYDGWPDLPDPDATMKDWREAANNAGVYFRSSGKDYTSGVGQAGLMRSGMVQWMNNWPAKVKAPKGVTNARLKKWFVEGYVWAGRKKNPSNPSSSMPGLAKWNTFAGGTSVPQGKYGYDWRDGEQTYTIQPISVSPGSRRVKYQLTVYPGVPAHGHQNLGSYSSPQKAVNAARYWRERNVLNRPAESNPSRFIGKTYFGMGAPSQLYYDDLDQAITRATKFSKGYGKFSRKGGRGLGSTSQSYMTVEDEQGNVLFDGRDPSKLHHRNPESSAADLFESFHGSPSTTTLEITEDFHEHDNLTELGDLEELKVVTVTGKDVTIGFESDNDRSESSKSNPYRRTKYGADMDAHHAIQMQLGSVGKALTSSELANVLKRYKALVMDGLYDPFFQWPGVVDDPESEKKSRIRLFDRALRKYNKAILSKDYYKPSQFRERPANQEAVTWPYYRNPDGSNSNASDAPKPKLASNEAGTQLFIIGGDQSLDLEALYFKGAELDKESVMVGVLYELTYSTAKKFHSFKLTDYYHELGEKSGKQPFLVYDRLSSKLSISGGNYLIKPEGITD